jgi:DNA-binding NarL/FixJ family response regulator
VIETSKRVRSLPRLVGPTPQRREARVVLVDDNELVRSGLRSLVSGARGLEVVGEASNGRAALALCGLLHPELVLVDACMPDIDGLTVVRTIADTLPEIRTVVISFDDAPGLFLEALRSGADAYLVKGDPRGEFLSAVRHAALGAPLIRSRIAGWILSLVAGGPRRWAAVLTEPLTPVECDVLRLRADGYSDQQIGCALRFTSAQVAVHLERVLAKLGRHPGRKRLSHEWN